MITVKVENLHVHVTIADDEHHHHGEILTQLANVRKDIKEFREAMKLTDQELIDLLQGIDSTTTHTGENVQKIADVTQVISTEMDTFLAAAPVGTVLTEEQVAKLQSIKNTAQAASDAGDAQVLVLQAVAAKGQPVVPPPPPPVEIPLP
jgi:methyl-accepting chemotaxis protein